MGDASDVFSGDSVFESDSDDSGSVTLNTTLTPIGTHNQSFRPVEVRHEWINKALDCPLVAISHAMASTGKQVLIDTEEARAQMDLWD